MSLINSSYFIGERNIPNTSFGDVVSLLDKLITDHEEEYLEVMLGYELFNLYKAGIAVVPPDQKWLDLRDGKEFTRLDGRKTKWTGFKDETNFNSPIADYIFYYWLKHNATQLAAMGEVQTQNENSSPVSVAHRMARSWNKMVKLNCILHEFLAANQTAYPEYQIHAGSREHRNLLIKINAFNF